MSRFRALPYAKALFEVVRGSDTAEVDRMIGELETFGDLVERVPELLKVQVSPAVATETKERILDEILDRLDVTPTTRRFLHVVQGHYRLEHMAAIAGAFRDLVDRQRGRSRAVVETAVPLDDDQKATLTDVLSSLSGGDVLARFEDSPELLAGFRARIGSLVFDGSLVGQVDRLSRETLIEQG